MKTKLTHPSSPRSVHCRMGFMALFLLAFHATAHAQTSSNLVASVIAGGGNAIGTVGQWSVGAVGGFWNTFEVPSLRLQRTGGSVLIAWPASFTEFQLERSSAIGADVAWESVSQTVNEVNGENQITLPIGPRPQFFRLRVP